MRRELNEFPIQRNCNWRYISFSQLNEASYFHAKGARRETRRHVTWNCLYCLVLFTRLLISKYLSRQLGTPSSTSSKPNTTITPPRLDELPQAPNEPQVKYKHGVYAIAFPERIWLISYDIG